MAFGLTLNLVGHQQGAYQTVGDLPLKFDFVGSSGPEPSAAHETDFAMMQPQLRDVPHQLDTLINLHLCHCLTTRLSLEKRCSEKQKTDAIQHRRCSVASACSLTSLPAVRRITR